MSTQAISQEVRSIDRREFIGLGLRTAGVLSVLPAASVALAGCGSEPAGPDPTPRADGTPEAPRAEAPPTATPEPPPATSEGDESQLVTEIASVASLVSGVQYVNESPKPDQKCGNCQLYTAGSDGRGKCQLFQQGLVKETGWCVSWVAKIS